MIEVKIEAGDSRQRADKFIFKLLPAASKSLIYKQIRKKNITLNGKKMTGNEVLAGGDRLQFFFAQETYDKFSSVEAAVPSDRQFNDYINAYEANKGIEIVYEDDNILAINKPDNMLSQRADNKEASLNEWLIGYLLSKGAVSKESLGHFRPSVLNRLDKNTTGMVLASKNLLGANVISEALRDRSLDKYYLTLVAGSQIEDDIYKAYHYKDEAANLVSITSTKEEAKEPAKASEIITGVKKLASFNNEVIGDYSLLEIDLITGKSHQIRAHLAYLGHPVLGDYKYGRRRLNERLKGLGINHQMLHSYRMHFNDLPDEMNLTNKEIICNPPSNWRKLNVDLEN